MKWLKRLGIAALVLVVGVVIFGFVVHEEIPRGESGPFADLLARKLMAKVAMDRWHATGALQWTMAGRNEHIWDKKRGFARVKWDDKEVLLRTSDRSGIAKVGGEVVEDQALLDEAYKRWVNDAFWLNPMATFFDEGVTRELIELENKNKALVVRYSSGGVTPGDTYVWYHDGRFLPVKWKMWVSLLPIGGIEVTWENYRTLQTGAMVSTKHDWLLPFELEGVMAAKDVTTLLGNDPFAALTEAASQPAR